MENYAFIQNTLGLPTCLICNEKLSNNKKSNIKHHFLIKHEPFARKHPLGDESKAIVMELCHRMQKSTSLFSSWILFATNINTASFAVAQDINKYKKTLHRWLI
ncbi:hypothetical protein X975_02560, partial [Stegodyphus mimosarum]